MTSCIWECYCTILAEEFVIVLASNGWPTERIKAWLLLPANGGSHLVHLRETAVFLKLSSIMMLICVWCKWWPWCHPRKDCRKRKLQMLSLWRQAGFIACTNRKGYVPHKIKSHCTTTCSCEYLILFTQGQVWNSRWCYKSRLRCIGSAVSGQRVLPAMIKKHWQHVRELSHRIVDVLQIRPAVYG